MGIDQGHRDQRRERLTYGSDVAADVIDDATIQRPFTVYGVTKVFGEHLGAFYKRSYGLDFRHRGTNRVGMVPPGTLRVRDRHDARDRTDGLRRGISLPP